MRYFKHKVPKTRHWGCAQLKTGLWVRSASPRSVCPVHALRVTVIMRFKVQESFSLGQAKRDHWRLLPFGICAVVWFLLRISLTQPVLFQEPAKAFALPCYLRCWLFSCCCRFNTYYTKSELCCDCGERMFCGPSAWPYSCPHYCSTDSAPWESGNIHTAHLLIWSTSGKGLFPSKMDAQQVCNILAQR